MKNKQIKFKKNMTSCRTLKNKKKEECSWKYTKNQWNGIIRKIMQWKIQWDVLTLKKLGAK